MKVLVSGEASRDENVLDQKMQLMTTEMNLDKRTHGTEVVKELNPLWQAQMMRAYCMNSIPQIIIHPKNMQFVEPLPFFLLSLILQPAMVQI